MLSLVISRECLEVFKLCCEFVVDDQNILIKTRWHVVVESICRELSLWYDAVVIQCHRLLLCVCYGAIVILKCVMQSLWYFMSWLNGTCHCNSVIWVDYTVRQLHAHHCWHLLKKTHDHLCPISGDSHSAQNWYDIFIKSSTHKCAIFLMNTFYLFYFCDLFILFRGASSHSIAWSR